MTEPNAREFHRLVLQALAGEMTDSDRSQLTEFLKDPDCERLYREWSQIWVAAAPAHKCSLDTDAAWRRLIAQVRQPAEEPPREGSASP